jgi:quercetin dioxygenase-like cupin family protein
MDPPKVERWDFARNGLMTLDKIREPFIPADRFRVSSYEYPSGAEFAGASTEGVCYVLQGQITYRFEKFSFEISLSAGEFANLPAGSHLVLVGKEQAVSLVKVWELPAEFLPN